MDDRGIHRLLELRYDCKGQRHAWHLRNLLDRKKCASAEAPEEQEAESRIGLYKWDGHWNEADDNGIVYDHCREEIRKVARIVMADHDHKFTEDVQNNRVGIFRVAQVDSNQGQESPKESDLIRLRCGPDHFG
ncbi:ankyrin repeat protein [Colletotrichum graminicola]|nr:ankyrin repeat protein [Colletotrichum graminicola]